MIITNGKMITWTKPNEIIENKSILIQGDVIKKIDTADNLLQENPGEEILDAKNQYIMPGLICAHTHFYGAYSRGLAIPGDPPAAFPEILSNLWWALDKALDEESVASSAWVCIIDAIKHGNTSLFDHHASPNAIANSLDLIADVVDQSGIRASLCYEVTDRDGEQKAREGINENVRFITRIKNGNNLNGRLAATFGLHASLTLSEKTLELSQSLAPSGCGFHIHVAEHPVDEYDSIKKSGLRVVDRLLKHNILNERSIVAHAVHVDAKEVNILAETKTWVTHQPRSNMNNAVGIGNIESMMRAGVKVCLGNDGFSNTMWDEWKTAYLVHKLVNLDPRKMGGYDVIEMAIYQNSALASQQFNLPIGSIVPGAQADIIFVDYLPFTDINPGNLPWHILFGMQHSMVTMTMVAGKILMKDKELVNIDERKIYSDAYQLHKGVWDRYKNQF
ncbi:MAG: hydrolase [Chloroflexi bacterium HGW-Chloroflexi-2]|jgi:putative selenium metabolism protein SsnA|nr:MAG: hydrolase [Chloroflexi bacterium HGW-Chloroflexi-2]